MMRHNAMLAAVATAMIVILGLSGCGHTHDQRSRPQRITFAISTDIHKDIMHDADQRLQAFVDAAARAKVNFIVDLGDFCQPKKVNQGFLDIWNSFNGPRYRVLGNHDMDGGFTRPQSVAFMGMPAQHYSFDIGGWHFVVLDGNDPDVPPRSGYASRIGTEQMEWLKADLQETQKPTVLFSHQGLASSLRNGAEVRAALETINHAAGWTKVVAAFNGHDHLDRYAFINGIHYLTVNSMSNDWLGEKYKCVRYSPEIDAKFPYIKYTAPYRDPLFALVTMEPHSITIKGVTSQWVGPSPKDLKFPESLANSPDKTGIAPRISSRRLEIK
ncbi:MAG: metallophosphoesterase [Verrucomicrobia bacterium]|nr:metallophosphoesterase [Verrucomicrobiota bacterium]